MADEEIVVTEPSNQHPLQHNYLPGPKGAYVLKKTEDGIYIRVDMPGAIQTSVNVDKDKDKDNTRHEIHFGGVSMKKIDLPFVTFDKSSRCYIGTIKVECQDFEQVLVNHQVNDGTC
ncbi:uncharacterized protein LOC110695297 [Chenopodium quinoa]|uniref:uncharacterized protein LOC110695297 n=1 Tax=Chenopodium quinoa TaxID=63459 RepID=UPI000B77FADE|nr:uncharacterized protein LOC110695297 [Chenopodium quinoa]